MPKTSWTRNTNFNKKTTIGHQIILNRMFLIYTNPIPHSKMEDNVHFLLMRHTAHYLKMGVNKIHIVFDNPGRISDHPKSAVRPVVQLLQIQKCIRCHIPMHAIFAIFYQFFLLVVSRSSFTSRTPNKDQKIEQFFYFLLVQVL